MSLCIMLSQLLSIIANDHEGSTLLCHSHHSHTMQASLLLNALRDAVLMYYSSCQLSFLGKPMYIYFFLVYLLFSAISQLHCSVSPKISGLKLVSFGRRPSHFRMRCPWRSSGVCLDDRSFNTLFQIFASVNSLFQCAACLESPLFDCQIVFHMVIRKSQQQLLWLHRHTRPYFQQSLNYHLNAAHSLCNEGSLPVLPQGTCLHK